MLQNRDGEPKSFRLYGLFSLVLLFAFTSAKAQSFEEFKRSQAVSFAKYSDERDNDFHNYLKSQWKAYKQHQGIKLYDKPKPKNIAKLKQKKLKSVGPKISIKLKKIQKTKQPQKSFGDIAHKDIEFDFFGSALGFDISQNIKMAKYYPYNQKGISNFFDTMASSQYNGLLKDIKKVQKDMQLNDWGVYLLIKEMAKNIYEDNEDNENLFSWFIFNKLGYAVKVGLAKKHTVLLFYSKKVIYSTPNYSFGDKKYYLIANYAKGGVGRLYSYEYSYPGASKPLSLSLGVLPKFVEDRKKTTLGFREFGKRYEVTYIYNQNLIDFMATYPQADYEVFFNTPLADETYTQLAKSLKKYLDGKKAGDAMNFVLHFVQKSFGYERDDEQFGREKVMFAQEALYYKKSDCEDRAVLYAALIKELFGVGVVGVKYKDHMATALYVPMSGDRVKDGSREFVIADPTYINANIGQSMPKYRSKIPESFIVVKLKS